MSGARRDLRLLVCGGRDYADRAAAWRVLDRLHAERGVALLMQGGATGADALALAWARARGVPCEAYPADWRAHGRAAGPLRNGRMLAEGRPDAVLAFPGGAGTADMLRRARAAGVPTWQPRI